MQGRLGWQISTIGDIAEIKYGKARPQEAGSIPLVGSGGIYGYTNQALVDYETIVLGRKGSAGSVYYIDEPCYPSDTTFYLKWKKDVSVPFIYYWILLKGFNQDNSVIPSLQREDIKNFPIAFPPLPEQRAIARVLRAVQEVMQALRRELELERERKAALMHHLFRYGTRGEPTKQTEIGEIPQSWEVVRLGDMVTLQRGVDLPVQMRAPGVIPVVGSNGIVGWHNQALSDVPIPGVTVGRSGSVGLLCYLDRPYWPLNTVLYVKDFHGNDPRFIYYWLHLFGFEKYSQGVSVPTLNRNIVYPIPFPVPPLAEQQQIAQLMTAIDSLIAALEQELALYQELFRTLLEELMSGRLSVQPLLEQEPALDT